MIASYRMIYGLLTPAQKRTFHGLLVLMVVMGATELAGVALLLPFLAVVADPAVIEAQPRLSALYDGLGFQSDFAFLQFLGLVTFAIIMIGLSLRMFTLYRVNLFVRHAATTLGTARLRHYFSQSYEWFLDRHSADLSKSVLQEINEVVIGSLGPAMRVISNGAVALFIGAFVVMVDPLGAIVIGAVLGLGYGAVHLALSRSLAERGRDRRRANRERYQAMGEALGGIKEVKMLDLEASYLRKYHEPSRRLAGHQAALTLIGEVPRFALEALTFGGILLYTLWLLFSRDGQIQAVLPVLGAFAFAGLRLMPVVQLLFRDVSQIRFGHAALEALADDLREGVRGPLLTLPGRNADPVEKLGLREGLELTDIHYRYPGGDGDALSGLSLRIPAGACVGFAGASGAGKTTVTDLLLGLVTPYRGEVRADGRVIGPDDLPAWRRTVGFVPQTIHLIDASLAGNIARGVPPNEVDAAALDRAIALASLGDLVADLPQGVRTPIGEAGTRLSGGQRQRVGIARALYRDPDVLVFDEATSALDTVTERSVMAAIRHLQGTKTIVLVSHRLSTLASCDTIFLMRGGRIIGSGDYATLSAENTAFQEMLEAAE